jgi:hypothetical protein
MAESLIAKPSFILGFNIDESWGNLGFYMSKDSNIGLFSPTDIIC